jgi:hypothetical protein
MLMVDDIMILREEGNSKFEVSIKDNVELPSKFSSVSDSSLGPITFELDVILWVEVGGRGSISGTLANSMKGAMYKISSIIAQMSNF